ncbi:hypothetical protein [Bythopirellula polymerisocia]|uniref:Uncharacterized protein n=1 Tax=Bythopirellula polymerisocia TaxID=2528003 RepID=A0A5C6CWU1_9BACT|nr:hypothetical protein [Bythopirellula polymerisocia]TWU29433.1 hypothetical protein Pla144_02110 [Bythopirellula polymerisocia]
MAHSKENNERLTTIVCTLVAIAILAAGVTARQNDSSSSNEPEQWESDVRYQIKTVFRHDARKRDERLAEVEAVMAAWKESTQSDSDRELLIDWLSETAVRSIPGSINDLPSAPEFSGRESNNLAQSQSTVLPRQVLTPPLLIPKLLSGTAPLERQITPTPYDPFAEIEETPSEAPKKIAALEQPPSVIPTQQRAVNKRNATSATWPPAPLPGSSLVSFDTIDETSPAEQPIPVAEPPVAEPVTVNLTELAARVAGYHDVLDEIETSLLRADSANLTLVAEQANRLYAMTRDYRFLKLYYESLTEAEQRSILEPRPLSATLREVDRQLDRYEASLDSDFLGSIDGAQAEQIAELRELLSAINSRMDN